jgi:cell division protein ZapA
VGHLKSQFGEIGDLRITVMAGIMVMDELSELSRKVASLEAEVEKLNSARAGALEDRDQNEQVLVSTLSELTGRLDSLAAKLTGRTTSLN